MSDDFCAFVPDAEGCEPDPTPGPDGPGGDGGEGHDHHDDHDDMMKEGNPMIDFELL